MISAEEALQIILDNPLHLPSESVDLSKAVNRILVQDVLADRDLPPFDRVMMDGIAIRHQDWKNGCRKFRITGIQKAGEESKTLENSQSCLEVMTGAMLPQNSDSIIPYEQVKVISEKTEKFAILTDDPVLYRQSVHDKGIDRTSGDVLISKYAKISAAEIGVLATVGMQKVPVVAVPKIAVIATGDELVAVNQVPKPYQIRQSNVFSIQAALKQLNLGSDIFHLADEKSQLYDTLHDILAKYDVLILSGGVSKGKADYIPEVMNELGVDRLFHKVAQRPGKPFWMGVYQAKKYVFAFPGNPVSTFIGFFQYFKPWLYKSLRAEPKHRFRAKLANDFLFKPQLTHFLLVRIEITSEAELLAHPSQGGGSGDLAQLVSSDGYLILPASKSEFKKGEVYPLNLFRVDN